MAVAMIETRTGIRVKKSEVAASKMAIVSITKVKTRVAVAKRNSCNRRLRDYAEQED